MYAAQVSTISRQTVESSPCASARSTESPTRRASRLKTVEQGASGTRLRWYAPGQLGWMSLRHCDDAQVVGMEVVRKPVLIIKTLKSINKLFPLAAPRSYNAMCGPTQECRLLGSLTGERTPRPCMDVPAIARRSSEDVGREPPRVSENASSRRFAHPSEAFTQTRLSSVTPKGAGSISGALLPGPVPPLGLPLWWQASNATVGRHPETRLSCAHTVRKQAKNFPRRGFDPVEMFRGRPAADAPELTPAPELSRVQPEY